MCVLSRMRHEDDPDAWPTVIVLSKPRREDMIAHIEDVHAEVWNALTQGLSGEEQEE